MRVLLTGVVDGLGRSLADNLLKSGHTVTGLDLNKVGLIEMEEEWPEHFVPLPVDLSDLSATLMALELLVSGENYDLVVLNAGVSATGKFAEIPASAYRKMLNVNVEAPMVLASQLMATNKLSIGGTIVFISSLSHASGYPGASTYCASKDAISSYSRSIRRSCALNGVNILTVFPGPIKTAHAERHAPKGASASRRIAPEALAQQILQAVKKRKHVFYPGMPAKIVRITGWIMPGMMTRMMRRIIYEKLDRTVF